VRPERGLARYRFLNEPDDRREDRAGDAAAHRLADNRADIDGAGRSGEAEQLKRNAAARAADRAGDRVADRAEVDVLQPRTDGVTTERAGNERIIRLITVPDMKVPPWLLSRRRSRSRNTITVKLTKL